MCNFLTTSVWGLSWKDYNHCMLGNQYYWITQADYIMRTIEGKVVVLGAQGKLGASPVLLVNYDDYS